MGAKTMKGRRSPITETTAHGKMSPQEAVGYGNWPDEESRQTKHFVTKRTSKHATLRRHRNGR